MKRKPISWATGALLVMMVSTVIYGVAEVSCYATYATFLPMEYTYGFFAVFVSEVAAMAALKVNKHKEPVNNRYLENMGIYNDSISTVVEAEEQETNNAEVS